MKEGDAINRIKKMAEDLNLNFTLKEKEPDGMKCFFHSGPNLNSLVSSWRGLNDIQAVACLEALSDVSQPERNRAFKSMMFSNILLMTVEVGGKCFRRPPQDIFTAADLVEVETPKPVKYRDIGNGKIVFPPTAH